MICHDDVEFIEYNCDVGAGGGEGAAGVDEVMNY